MKMIRLLPIAGLVLMAALASGCAGPLSKDLLRQTDPSVTVGSVAAKPDAHKNSLVVWGGTIISTRTYQDNTVIEVLEKPLDYQKRPKYVDTSSGRFKARYSGFLDPSLFRYDRDITVIGRVVGTETSAVGDYQYTYPVVEVREYYLWPRRTPDYYNSGYPTYYPYYSPFYGSWWYYW